jgi:hypothetical protein
MFVRASAVGCLLAGLGVTVVACRASPSSEARPDKQSSVPSSTPTTSTAEQRAIAIAEAELLRHFPSGTSFGIRYTVSSTTPGTTPTQWVVRYTLPRGPTDTDVYITVDVASGAVVLFHQPGA